MLVVPTMTAPAWRRRCTTSAVRCAGGASASRREPPSVGKPAMSNRSLTETGRPSMGERARPAARSTSLARASARAAPWNTRVNTLGPSPNMVRARACSVSCTEVVSPPCRRCDASSRLGRGRAWVMWEVLWVKAGVGGSESRLRPRRPAVRCGSCGGWNAGCGDRTAPWRTASRGGCRRWRPPCRRSCRSLRAADPCRP